MNVILAILFVMSIIFCVILCLCVVGFALNRKEIVYRKRTLFMNEKYYDYTFFRENSQIFHNFETKPWDDIKDNS